MTTTHQFNHPVSGPVQVVDLDGLLACMDADLDTDLGDRIKQMLERPDVTGMCIYEVLQMDSSAFGCRSAMIFGPGCTSPDAEHATQNHLGSVPSRFAYPKYIHLKP